MYLSNIKIKNFRTFNDIGIDLDLKEGLNLIVGENNSGKTALLDAIRLILGTRDNERIWLDKIDFYYPTEFENESEKISDHAKELSIECIFKGFNENEAAPFLEWIGVENGIKEYFLKLKLIARRNEKEKTKYGSRITVDITAGPDDKGTQMDGLAKELLRATYLKPLRNAEQELKAKRGSRLSQILYSHPKININTQEGKKEKDRIEKLIKELNEEILKSDSVYKDRQDDLNDKYFSEFLFKNEELFASIAMVNPDFREILEKLELNIDKNKPQGLGINNLLFMATELLLLKPQDDDNDLPLLLIEEPEAHIHPQYQLNLINYFENQNDVQVLMTTHSPNLASKVDIERLIIVKEGNVFPMGHDYTNLEQPDYEFLRRFLDVTKANIFFAKGIIIVEGDSEALLLPTIAELINKPLHKYGVSILNVGHKGLFRYSKILSRKKNKECMGIKVACIGDLDIAVKEAEDYLKRNKSGDLTVETTKSIDETGLNEKEKEVKAKYEEGLTMFFASKPWTLEFSLAESLLAKQLHLAIELAKSDDKEKETKAPNKVESDFKNWESETPRKKASNIYEPLYKKQASKPESIQYFIREIKKYIKENTFTIEEKKELFPKYLVDAIDYVTENSVNVTNNKDV